MDQAPASSSADEAIVARYAADLVDAVEAALGPWIRSAVARRYPGELPAAVQVKISEITPGAVEEIVSQLRSLLRLDIDDQWTNPLSIIRGAVRYPTAILAEQGIAPVDRDATARRLHPDDVYDLTPAAFGDLGQAVHEPGLVWGAAKAHLHLKRRKREVA